MQGPSASGLTFTLDDGYTAVVGPEEGRVYDQIIESNVGFSAKIALEGERSTLMRPASPR